MQNKMIAFAQGTTFTQSDFAEPDQFAYTATLEQGDIYARIRLAKSPWDGYQTETAMGRMKSRGAMGRMQQQRAVKLMKELLPVTMDLMREAGWVIIGERYGASLWKKGAPRG